MKWGKKIIVCLAAIGMVAMMGCGEQRNFYEQDNEKIENSDVEENNEEEENFDDRDKDVEISYDESLEATYDITSKWKDHYNVDVTLLNICGRNIDDWEVCFEFKDKIEKIWNAKIVECDEGESVVIRNTDGNQDIAIDDTVTFGMTVSYKGEIELPQGCYLTREEIEIDADKYIIEYKQHDKWDGHVKVSVIITNKGKKRIEDWKLDFKTAGKIKSIENMWDAKLFDVYEHHYCEVDNATYNQNIEPGESVEFGFVAECDEDFVINETTLYQMEEANYVDGEDQRYTIDPNSEDWEPDYDLDDFDTYEEYMDYLEENDLPLPKNT